MPPLLPEEELSAAEEDEAAEEEAARLSLCACEELLSDAGKELLSDADDELSLCAEELSAAAEEELLSAADEELLSDETEEVTSEDTVWFSLFRYAAGSVCASAGAAEPNSRAAVKISAISLFPMISSVNCQDCSAAVFNLYLE